MPGGLSSLPASVLFACLLWWSSAVPAGAVSGRFGLGLWNVQSVNGTLSIGRDLQRLDRYGGVLTAESTQTASVRGRILLNSISSIWHPNFLLIDTAIDYNPQIQQQSFLTVPDRGEARTARQFRVNGTLLRNLPVSARVFTAFDHNFANREDLDDVETRRTDFGGSLSFRNKMLPMTGGYVFSRLLQTEFPSGRAFTESRHQIRLRASKSLVGRDETKLSFTKESYVRDYSDSPPVRNRVQSINLSNELYFDQEGLSNLTSVLRYSDQAGTTPSRRMQIQEILRRPLSGGFTFSGDYQYLRLQQNDMLGRHTLVTRLSHRLYESLESEISFRSSRLNQTAYGESIRTKGLRLAYRKKVPTGLLKVVYERLRGGEERGYEAVEAGETSRVYTLRDEEPVFLDQPGLDPTSVVVTDASGLVVFESGIDYTLLQRGLVVELRRAPGGRIANGTEVSVSLSATGEAAYSYGTHSRNLSANLVFFGQAVQLRYQTAQQGYDNVEGTDLRLLRTTNRRVMGIRLRLGPLDAGYERDRLHSNLLPSRSQVAYVNFAHTLFGRIGLVLRADQRFLLLTDVQEKQEAQSMTGRLTFKLGRVSVARLISGFRTQEGLDNDLRQVDLRAELRLAYRRVFLNLGTELYRREFIGESTDFDNTYVRLERRL